MGSESSKMGKVDTLLADGAEFRGSLIAKGTVRVDGKVEGGIVSEDGIIVGETGMVKGDMAARFVVLAGKVTGDVQAQSRVELLPTAQLYGDIRTPRLIIAEGVLFEGNCEMLKERPDAELKAVKK